MLSVNLEKVNSTKDVEIALYCSATVVRIDHPFHCGMTCAAVAHKI